MDTTTEFYDQHSGCHCHYWCFFFSQCCNYCQAFYNQYSAFYDQYSEITTMDTTTEFYDQHSEVYLLLCEGQKKIIACPSNAIIEIVSASYGYNGSSTSAREECDTLAWFWELGNDNTRCHEQRSGDILTTKCGGSSECEVFASSEVFGDPCPGTRKFLEVFYHCRADWHTTPLAGFPTTTLPFRSEITTMDTTMELSCTFEYGTCSFFQSYGDDFDWTRRQGSTPSSYTGPSGDHTTGTGYYMYIEASGRAAYSKARLVSSPQDATDDQERCLVFFYHMYGDTINTLNVYLSSGGQEERIFTRSHNHGNIWLRTTTQFQSSSTWQIIFEGKIGTSYTGDIAIDDISILPWGCSTSEISDWHTTPPADFPTTTLPFGSSWYTTPSVVFTSDETKELGCTFEYGTCCYYQMVGDDFDWTRQQGSTPSIGTGPSADHTTGTGYYMYIEATGKAANSKARLISPSQDATDHQGLCLSFFYHMYGATINTLNVYLSSGRNEELIFTRSQNQSDNWWQATVQIQSSSTWRIIFEGRTGTDFTSDIAIDDISIFPGSCPSEDLPTTPPDVFLTTFPASTWCHCDSWCFLYNQCCSYCQELDCTFEYGTCRYYQMGGDDFDWTRRQGSTPSSGTGPSGDHTTRTGYYMYIEATNTAANSTARLISPSQDATDDQGLCLYFFYHMYGATINTLNVYLSSGGNEELIFTRSQNQGDNWWQATVQIQSSSTWRIIFEGKRGLDFTGDIAIDDISIFPGSCPSEDLPTTPPADLFLTIDPAITYSNPLIEVVFVDSVYNFASPNFPRNYPNHLSAKWVFSTFEGLQLLLKFRVLVTEEFYDRVRVGSGNTTDRSYALYWSGGPPESDVQFLSSGNTLWMTLDTDFSVTYSGFAASVEAVKMSLSDLDCDDFNCANDGVCIPHSNVCDSVENCGSKNDEENCPGWNTEQPGWNTEQPEPSNFDEISLHCGPTSFQVDIPMQLLPDDMQPNDFYFSKDPFDPSCRGFQNGDDYFSLNSSLTGCGTVYVENQTMSSYLNWVVYTINTSSVVEYQSDNLPVTCDFDRSKQLQSNFVITDQSGQRIKRAKGSLVYDFSMYTDVNFDTRYDSYPVETTLNRNLYFRAELLRSPDNLRIHLRSCRATPSQNFDDAVVYELIHDGCGINNANVRVLTQSNPAQTDFEIRNIRPDLSNHTSQVWIHCEVVVCDVNDPNSECLHDCERSRRRRSVAESSKEAKRLIQGPILFTDIEDLDQKSGSFLSMEERQEVIIFTVALTAVCLVMFLSLLVVGGALFKIMRRVKRLEYRPLQNEKYTTL